MSVFETVGRDISVSEVVEVFYDKLKNDEVVATFFETADVEAIKRHQTMFLTAAVGGPDAYEGRDMRATHADLPITDADFDHFLDHLAMTFTELGATPEWNAGMLETLEPLRTEIVSAPGEGPGHWGSEDPTGGGD